jgi:hypothetical protein
MNTAFRLTVFKSICASQKSYKLIATNSLAAAAENGLVKVHGFQNQKIDAISAQ